MMNRLCLVFPMTWFHTKVLISAIKRVNWERETSISSLFHTIMESNDHAESELFLDEFRANIEFLYNSKEFIVSIPETLVCYYSKYFCFVVV